MRIFLDTGNIEQIEKGLEWGILDGVTTNPSLLAKEGKPYQEQVLEICRLVGNRPVSVEVLTSKTDEIIRQGMEIASWAENIVVKVATTAEGLPAIHYLSQKGIAVNATLIFSAPQGFLAIKAGAKYVSPFIGRLDDIGGDGVSVVSDLVDFVETYGYPAEVLAASIRHPTHVMEVAKAGAHIATIPYDVLMKLIRHPLTDTGLEQFLRDWRAVEEKWKKIPAG
ncbi:MAG: fructose-6-phosphate aldolase [bacterium JZ-2024 1]